MPRFSTVPLSGCKPLRLITGDELGYLKVVESRGENAGQSQVVARWGDAGKGKGVQRMQEQAVAVGGKGLDVNLWSLETKAKLWQAKNTRPDVLGLQTPVWVTQLLFLGGDGNKVLAGTGFIDRLMAAGDSRGHHQLRLYDVKAQRRPVMVMEFGELPIWSVAEDPSGHVVYAGNSTGELASFDLRTGTKSGGFVGSISGAVRSIAVHPTESLMASVGLDRFLRIHSTKTRQLLAKVFLKQQMVACAFDTDPARQPEEAEPVIEEAEDADNDSHQIGHVPGSEAVDDENNSEEEGASTRKQKLEGRDKGKKRKKGLDNSDEDEIQEAWEDSDEEDEVGETKRRKSNKEERARQKGKKGLRKDDEDSDKEGFSGGGLDQEWDEDSDDDLEEGGRKGKSKISIEIRGGKKGGLRKGTEGGKKGGPKHKGAGGLVKRKTPQGKKKSRQRT